jgi:hypothetical protein
MTSVRRIEHKKTFGSSDERRQSPKQNVVGEEDRCAGQDSVSLPGYRCAGNTSHDAIGTTAMSRKRDLLV